MTLSDDIASGSFTLSSQNQNAHYANPKKTSFELEVEWSLDIRKINMQTCSKLHISTFWVEQQKSDALGEPFKAKF